MGIIMYDDVPYGANNPDFLAPTPFIYSEDEEQVGIWIDGKPLYQRGFSFNISSVNDWTLFDNSVSYGSLISAFGDIETTTASFPIVSNFNDEPRWSIQNNKLMYYYSGSQRQGKVIVLYTKTTDTAWQGGFKAYGFTPVIYSTEEREIGVYTDGKPLYQIIVEHNEVKNVAYHGDYSFAAGISNVDTCVMCISIYNPNWDLGHWRQNYPSYYHVNSGNIVLWNEDKNGNSNEIAGVKTILQYTKTTDTAGSGKYTTLGTPSVHYDGEERIIGTWFGETLYRKAWTGQTIYLQWQSGNSFSYAQWTNNDLSVIGQLVSVKLLSQANNFTDSPTGGKVANQNAINLYSKVQTTFDTIILEYTKTS